MTDVFTPEPLTITDRAIRKILELIEEEGDVGMNFRVFVSGGGCSGFQYGFTFDCENQPDDTRILKNGITVSIDGLSYPYLVGATLDYSESLVGSQFVVNNPNAKATCGCGASFTI